MATTWRSVFTMCSRSMASRLAAVAVAATVDRSRRRRPRAEDRRLDLVALGEDRRALDRVQQLAHVAGPGDSSRERQRRLAEALEAVRRVGLDEVLRRAARCRRAGRGSGGSETVIVLIR
jgi:hypothetical protein